MQLLTVAMVPLQHITVGWYVTGCSSLLRNITWTQKQMDIIIMAIKKFKGDVMAPWQVWVKLTWETASSCQKMDKYNCKANIQQHNHSNKDRVGTLQENMLWHGSDQIRSERNKDNLINVQLISDLLVAVPTQCWFRISVPYQQKNNIGFWIGFHLKPQIQTFW